MLRGTTLQPHERGALAAIAAFVVEKDEHAHLFGYVFTPWFLLWLWTILIMKGGTHYATYYWCGRLYW
jgi:hypothetical protein